METKQIISNIHWLGHDSFRIEGDGLVIYIDPWQLESNSKADIILVTHEHHDHFSPKDIATIQKKDSILVSISAIIGKIPGQTQVVEPGDQISSKGVSISTVPAYNVNKFRSPGIPFHPRESGHVGFIITLEGRRIYHAGDTDFIPEMESIDTDIALLPVSGIYVMSADEALEALKAITPQIAIPMHIGKGIGSLADAQYFKENTSVPVEILPLEK